MQAPAGSSDSPLLRVRGVTKRFPGVVALENISLDCWAGEVHALVGENGAGKSTLIKILAGAYAPDGGSIEFGGRRYQALSPELARTIGISAIHQEFNLVPDMSVAENMFLGVELHNRAGVVNQRRMAERARERLARLGSRLDVTMPVSSLTVAEQQIVEIAKALLTDARLIVMDEPSAVLGGRELERLLEVVQALRQHGVAVLYVSHRLAEVFRVSQRVTVLKDGRLVGTHPTADATQDGLIRMMIGRSLTGGFPSATRPPGSVILTVRNLRVGSFLKGVSFELHEGEILGIGGLVGSGRTTLARALFGAERYEGTVEVEGRPRRMRSPVVAIASRMSLVPEDRKQAGLVLGKTVRFNVSLPHVRRLSRLGVVLRALESRLVRALVDQVSLQPPDPDRDVAYLSGGNQQKVVLAKWLAQTPRIVILDEPTRGIDVGAKAEIYQQVRGLADRGAGLIMISSELLELLGMSDRILVLCEGRLTGELSKAAATEEALMQLATRHGASEVLSA